jgi:hypothetical protein
MFKSRKNHSFGRMPATFSALLFFGAMALACGGGDDEPTRESTTACYAGMTVKNSRADLKIKFSKNYSFTHHVNHDGKWNLHQSGKWRVVEKSVKNRDPDKAAKKEIMVRFEVTSETGKFSSMPSISDSSSWASSSSRGKDCTGSILHWNDAPGQYIILDKD